MGLSVGSSVDVSGLVEGVSGINFVPGVFVFVSGAFVSDVISLGVRGQ